MTRIVVSKRTDRGCTHLVKSQRDLWQVLALDKQIS